MYTAKITLTGVTLEELEMALEEAKTKISEGYTSGGESRENDTGSYSFEVEGEEAKSWECKSCGYDNYIVDENEIDEDTLCFNCNEEKGV